MKGKKLKNQFLHLTSIAIIVCAISFTSCQSSATSPSNGNDDNNSVNYSTGSLSIDDNTQVLSQRVKTYKNNKSADGIEDLTLIASIDPPYDDYQLSATSVNCDAQSNIYVTWHKRGTDYHGYVDAINNSNEIPVISHCIGSPDVDYNHVIAVNNKLFVMGDNNKIGAYLCVLDLSSKTQYMYPLDGASGNCIANASSNYFTASGAHGGFASFTDNGIALSSLNSKTATYAKFVANNSNKMVTFDANEDGSVAYITYYDINDVSFSNPINRFPVGNFLPLDGKNVCLIDAQNNVYVALGTNGIRKYSSDGTLLASSNCSTNGLDVDNRYLYVASSSKGLVVLDKSTLANVTAYKCEDDASANFVKVLSDGTIYVAYGTVGVKVFDWE